MHLYQVRKKRTRSRWIGLAKDIEAEINTGSSDKRLGLGSKFRLTQHEWIVKAFERQECKVERKGRLSEVSFCLGELASPCY